MSDSILHDAVARLHVVGPLAFIHRAACVAECTTAVGLAITPLACVCALGVRLWAWSTFEGVRFQSRVIVAPSLAFSI